MTTDSWDPFSGSRSWAPVRGEQDLLSALFNLPQQQASSPPLAKMIYASALVLVLASSAAAFRANMKIGL